MALKYLTTPVLTLAPIQRIEVVGFIGTLTYS